MIKLIFGDCLEEMDKLIKEGIKVDAILTDPPQRKTACKWDVIIPFGEMWKRLKLLRKNRTPIVLFGNEPFSSMLRISNIKEYKYDWVWNKDKAFGVFIAKKQPLRTFENIIIFYKKQCNYFSIMENAIEDRIRPLSKGNIYGCVNNITNSKNCKTDRNYDPKKRYPKNIIVFSNPVGKAIHPTQKPISLMEYLIKTYTKENDIVLDFTMGSGSTGVACKNLNRQFIGIENNKKYYDIANGRINNS